MPRWIISFSLLLSFFSLSANAGIYPKDVEDFRKQRISKVLMNNSAVKGAISDVLEWNPKKVECGEAEVVEDEHNWNFEASIKCGDNILKISGFSLTGRFPTHLIPRVRNINFW